MITFDYRLTKSPYFKYLIKSLGKKCYVGATWKILYYPFSKDYSIEIWNANTYSKTRTIEVDLIHNYSVHENTPFGYKCIKRISKVPQDKVLWVVKLLKKFARSLTLDDYDKLLWLREDTHGKRQIIYGEKKHKPIDHKKFEDELNAYLKNAKFDFSIIDKKVLKEVID